MISYSSSLKREEERTLAKRWKTALCVLALGAAIWMAWTQELAIRAGGQEVPYGVTAPAPGVWELLVPWSGR